MPTNVDALERCLSLLEEVWPYLYAQWLIEDAATLDYRVISSRQAPGRTSYEVAHRTGVIGQAFRVRRALVVPDTRSHVLYDRYDPEVSWELTVPAWHEGQLVAVLNIEGAGHLQCTADSWARMLQIVSATTGWEAPAERPDPGDSPLVRSVRLEVSHATSAEALIELGKAVGRGGASVVLVGDLVGRSLSSMTTVEAEQRGEPLGACISGLAARVDVCSTGPGRRGFEVLERLNGWALLEGRYDFTLTDPANPR